MSGAQDVGTVSPESDSSPSFRYGVVLLLTFVLVVFAIIAPGTDWSRATGLAIAGAALVVSISTARVREVTRRRNTIASTITMAVLLILVASGAVSQGVAAAMIALVIAAIPVVIAKGVVRMLSETGVTSHAVAGGLAIFLCIGLVFAWVITFVSQIDATPYFGQDGSGSQGDRVYFSFTTLTTTGYGDFAPTTPVGHALAVIEMLIGQIYLVTIIGLLVGNFAGRRKDG